MGIVNDFSALVNTFAKNMELKNQQQERVLRCQLCNVPYLCVQNVVIPVFSAVFGRQFIAEELYCECVNCLLRIALPQSLSQSNARLLQRRFERHIAKVFNKPFADVVKSHLVTVTSEYVLIRM